MTEIVYNLAEAVWPRWRYRRLSHLQRRALVAAGIFAAPFTVIYFLLGPAMALFIGPVDRILVDKSARQLQLIHDGEVVYTTSVALGKNPLGQKRNVGDNRTPEGKYRLGWRDPTSDHHKAILISYPNKSDRVEASSAGLSPGGEIMIHGQKHILNWFGLQPYTNGCIGVSNLAMDVIWAAVDDGAAIEIRP